MIRRAALIACAAIVPFAGTMAAARVQPPAAVEAVHARLAPQLTPDQAAAIAAAYPDFRLVALCRGRFSGAADELVAGIWKPLGSAPPSRRIVHRVGLVRERTGWILHAIDDELERDAGVTHSYPFTWDVRVDANAVEARMTCGVEPGQDRDIDGHGQRFFDRRRAGLERRTPVCFATSDVYNNWDCVLYSPADQRFRLWYQQARAD